MNKIEHVPAQGNPQEARKLQYFLFNQNNSGGSFDVDESVAHYVFIQAFTVGEACAKAEAVGVYFNGCDTGHDCSCCGDRWYKPWSDDGTETPLIDGEPAEQYSDMFTKEGEVYCYIYHYDGSKTICRRGAKE